MARMMVQSSMLQNIQLNQIVIEVFGGDGGIRTLDTPLQRITV